LPQGRRMVTMKGAFASPHPAMQTIPAVNQAACRLYLVTPPRLDPASFRDPLAAALDAGDVGAVQLRLKDVEDDTWRRTIAVLRPVVQSRDVAFLLNDRPDLARATGCDGAHVGQEDMAVREARRILGPDLTLGVSCHGSRELAMTGGEDGADYVAFGAFFPSGTKIEAPVEAQPEILAWWSEIMELPCVAIGGITAANCAPLVQAGADFLAVVSAVWDHPEGPAAGVRAMNAAIASAAEQV
jgi:thiamine-phosphate pyrophosphorylase